MSLLWRAGRGLWAVALLSAATIPVLLHVATLHRGHWSGSAGVDFWGSAVLPWSARLWAGLGVLVLAGWASSAAPVGAPTLLGRLRSGALAGGLGAAVWVLAALPALVWLARLGVDGVPLAFALATAAVVVAALLAATLGGLLPPAPSAAVGLAGGGALLWATWGAVA